MRRCVWSRNLIEEAMARVGPQRHRKQTNLKNEEAMARVGPQRHRKQKTNPLIYFFWLNWPHTYVCISDYEYVAFSTPISIRFRNFILQKYAPIYVPELLVS